MPAQAGIQVCFAVNYFNWMPACAGMTTEYAEGLLVLNAADCFARVSCIELGREKFCP